MEGLAVAGAVLGVQAGRAQLPDSQGVDDQIAAQVWQVISETVAANDIDRMASTYHPDSVLVSPKGTARIADQPDLYPLRGAAGEEG